MTATLSFATLLQTHIDLSGRSRKSVAVAAAVDHSFLTRIIQGKRAPSRSVITEIARVLDLRGDDRVQLFAAAGYLPPRTELELVAVVGGMDPTIVAVGTVLADGSLSEGERAAFRGVVEAIAARWGR